MEFNGQFSQALSTALEKQGYAIRSLSTELGISYEHTRKWTKGLAYPSKPRLIKLCKILKLDLNKMTQFIITDKLRRKYGKTVSIVDNNCSSQLQPFYEFAALLTVKQRNTWMEVGKVLQKTA